MPEIAFIWNREEMERLQTAIIVENWRRIMTTGSGKRKLNEQFTPKEIKRIQFLYKKYYNMQFKKVGASGTPLKHAMSIADYHLTKRAVHFFATT